MLYESFLLGEHYYSVFRSYYRQRTVTAVRKNLSHPSHLLR
jgi:hypothetical protein